MCVHAYTHRHTLTHAQNRYYIAARLSRDAECTVHTSNPIQVQEENRKEDVDTANKKSSQSRKKRPERNSSNIKHLKMIEVLPYTLTNIKSDSFSWHPPQSKHKTAVCASCL